MSVQSQPRRSARKPRGEGHSRRAEILAAAQRIFVEHGYEGATIRKIAEEVGLSSTALYMHFAEKGEILQEICRQAFQTLVAAHRVIMAEDAPPEARLRRMIRGYVDFGFANPDAYRLIYMTRPGEALHAQSAAEEVGGELFESFLALVRQLAEAGRVKAEPRAAALAIWAGAHGVVSLVITKPYFQWGDRDVLVDTTLDALLAGLLKP